MTTYICLSFHVCKIEINILTAKWRYLCYL